MGHPFITSMKMGKLLHAQFTIVTQKAEIADYRKGTFWKHTESTRTALKAAKAIAVLLKEEMWVAAGVSGSLGAAKSRVGLATQTISARKKQCYQTRPEG